MTTIKHNMTSGEKDKLMNGDAQQMTRLPLAFPSRIESCTPTGWAERSTSGGIVKRAVERDNGRQ